MTFQFRERNDSSFVSRGFFGVAIFDAKHESNVGVLWRSASVFGASFIATVGEKRYKTMKSDTMKSHRHIPLFHFNNIVDLRTHLPKGCKLVGIEMSATASQLQDFTHPEQSLYLMGAEDHGIPFHVLQQVDCVVKISTFRNVSLNVGVAGSIICYDRILKQRINGTRT